MISQDTRTTAVADPVTVLRTLTPGAGPDRADAVRRALHPGFAGPALVEYAGAVPDGTDPDGAVAALRALTRRTGTPGPGEVLAAVPETGDAALDDLAGSVALDLFADAVAAHGKAAAAAAIGTAFAVTPPRRGALLLDLAERHGLHCVPVSAAADAGPGDRRYRHALWRYLSQLDEAPAATEILAAAHIRAADPYERALSAVCLARQSGQGFESPLWTVPAADRRGLTVAQSMLLGSFDQPGAGASGGLTVLARHLGTALPRHAGIARVVTLTLAGRDLLRDRDTLAEAGDDGHLVLRLPVDSPGPPPQAELARHRPAIGFLARHLLWLADRTPDVVHVRYSDDGSAAVADAARAMGARTVFTLTADPHRSLAERHRAGRPGDRQAARFDLHRMYTADRLVAAADTLLGLPGRPDGELTAYFPRLRERPEPESVAEGIPVVSPVAAAEVRQEQLIDSLFAAGSGLPRLVPEARGLPVVLSVGRLHPVKQQDLLVEAWLSRGLYRHTALVLVGGDTTDPNDDEARILGRIRELASRYPAAAGRLAVLAAVSNEDVRSLEHGLSRRLPAPTPHLYVCPSRKEEFGIAVLEAMDAGLLVLGPRRGGLGHYIDHGRNGLLADTSSLAAFGDALTAFVRGAADDPARARAVAAAGRDTVARRFGIHEVAGRFAAVYQRTAGTTARPATANLLEGPPSPNPGPR
ncbi:glycosyltransferase family 4 protein [Amycolatopsis sp. NPDC005961]|uniref:glycosyltransferase family 4 protein n=1 Tax=Amycolatopsis sp. NPDC005961 TaxID=3156720 RepID=UPI00340395BE